MKKIYSVMLLGALSYNSFGQISMNASGSHFQDFNTLPSSGSTTWNNNNTIANWYAQRTGTGTSIMATDGSANSGNLYSFGSTGSGERALGSLGSGNAAAGHFAYGVLLRNTSTQTITDIKVSYVGEQWRDASGVTNVVEFYYKTASGSISDLQPNNNSSWTAVPALDFANLKANNTSAALNGNLAANRDSIAAVGLTGLSLAPGQYIMLKWDDMDHSGSDHGMAIDNVTITWTVPAANPIGTAPFRSKTSGAYNAAATWQYLSVSNPATWSDATQKPGSGNVVTIQAAHTVAMTADESADTLKINGTLVAADHALTTVKPVILNGSVTSTNEYGISNVPGSTFGTAAVSLNTNSTIEYTSSNTQFITGVNYSNLVLSGGDKYLSSNTAVSGTLSLGSILYTGSTALLQLGNAATVTGGSASTYIDGPVAKSSNTTTSYTLPIGKNGIYRPVIITPNATAATTFTAEYFDAAYSNTMVSAPLYAVSATEYWDISRSGTSSADITLTWGSSSGIADLSEVRLAHFNSTANAWEMKGGFRTGTPAEGTVTAWGISEFSPFTIGSSSVSLPVQLTSFKGYVRQGSNVLDWTTAMEQQNRGFEVLHATDGQHFTPISFVASRAPMGNSNTPVAYQFVHADPGMAKHYYKLAQIDLDGSRKESEVVLINNASTVMGAVFPNPAAQDHVQLQLGADAEATIIVTDINGKEVIRRKAGSGVYQLDVSSLTAGNYLIRVASPNGYTVKFVKL